MIDHLDAITVVVSDQDEALDYYTNTLGFDKRMDDEMPDYGRFLMVGPPKGQAGIVLFPENDEAKAGGSFGVVFNTDDIAATYDDLSGKGVNFVETPAKQSWGGTQAQFLDPDGNHYILIELPDFMKG